MSPKFASLLKPLSRGRLQSGYSFFPGSEGPRKKRRSGVEHYAHTAGALIRVLIHALLQNVFSHSAARTIPFTYRKSFTTKKNVTQISSYINWNISKKVYRSIEFAKVQQTVMNVAKNLVPLYKKFPERYCTAK